jgi:hypothetical protein
MGFEVVVRPAVLPNIRPPRAQVLPPEDNPEQGWAVIKGGNPQSLGASYSYQMSWTKSKPHKEEKRQFDKERVYQKDAAGKINKQNFVDIERLSRVRLNVPDGALKVLYAEPPEVDNVETIEKDVTREAST